MNSRNVEPVARKLRSTTPLKRSTPLNWVVQNGSHDFPLLITIQSTSFPEGWWVINQPTNVTNLGLSNPHKFPTTQPKWINQWINPNLTSPQWMFSKSMHNPCRPPVEILELIHWKKSPTVGPTWTERSPKKPWVSNTSSNLLRGPLVRSHSRIDGF